MRPSRSAAVVLGISLLATAILPLAALAQCDVPGIAGGGSAFQYAGTEGQTGSSNASIFDSFVLQRFIQARSMAARWLAASRPAGTRARVSTTTRGRTR